MIRRTVITAACATLALIGSAAIASAESSMSKEYTGGILHLALTEDPGDRWDSDWAWEDSRDGNGTFSTQFSTKSAKKWSKTLSKSKTRPRHHRR